MKRTISVFLAAAICTAALGLTACGTKPAESTTTTPESSSTVTETAETAEDANQIANPITQRGSLDLLRHVAMEVTVEIGRTRMTVGELLSLHPGEVVELDRAASAPADLLVNGTLIARGEVVVVDEDFGLRISEIITDAAASEIGGQQA